MIDFSKPLTAKIYDFDTEYIAEEEAARGYIVRQVEKIELPCGQHDEAILCYSGGFKSVIFEIIEQELKNSERQTPLTK